MNTLTIKPLTPELAADYFDFFDHRAFSDNRDWSSCYCTFFHMNQASEQEVSEEVRADGKRDALHRALRCRAEQFIADGTLRGYLAYVDGYMVIEGYPKLNEQGDAFNYTGPVRLFEKLGFAEVQRFEDRALMRKVL